MKISIKLFFTLIVTATLILAFSACSETVESKELNDAEINQQVINTVTELASEDLTDEEIASLQFMREEEKLARDVYLEMYSLYPLRVFNNISKSEQWHMDIVKALLDKYELSDPAEFTGPGEFQNEDLQNLYNQLIAQGQDSLMGSLLVGAAIEEIDLIDLQEQIDEVVDNEDIVFAYMNLMCGSRNHLRAFVRNLTFRGYEYTPQYLDEETYLAIINGDHEHCIIR